MASESEVARLLENIETTYLAVKRGLTGTAQVARHKFIEVRMAEIGKYQARLEDLIGIDNAPRLVVSTMELAAKKHELEVERQTLETHGHDK